MSTEPIQRVETVTGAIAPADLGRTLMHEHLTAGFAGYEANTNRPGQNFDERVAICIDQIHRLRDLGFTSMLDPCPNDLGREVELMARVSQDTGFNIVFATGLYKESLSGVALLEVPRQLWRRPKRTDGRAVRTRTDAWRRRNRYQSGDHQGRF